MPDLPKNLIEIRKQFHLWEEKFSGYSPQPIISSEVQIHSTAIITGPVVICPDVSIGEYVVIQGPCFIDRHVHVGSFCKIRPGTVLSEHVRLENLVEIKHSLIGRGTHVHSGYIGDSIIGEDCRIGAGFITGNRRLDRKTILIPVDGQLVDTHTSFFGCLMGNRVRVGIHCGTNPGTVISDDSVVLPMTMVSNHSP
jgi:UDP-N-acetylglucosamine diphosphorylase / glucose-1-phosphate thymidylyltransferase / UDP-N-acetylgalactosamine diphosphorylase / glucosamine-1-phosphate N-acetyltransferase / galactosamine-1-phosphate N-acetyltransferase